MTIHNYFMFSGGPSCLLLYIIVCFHANQITKISTNLPKGKTSVFRLYCFILLCGGYDIFLKIAIK